MNELQPPGTSDTSIFGLLPPCLAFKGLLCANSVQDTALTMKRLANMRGQRKYQVFLMTLEQTKAGFLTQVFCRARVYE